MSDNKEKDKDIKELPVATQEPGEMLNDLNELLSWMASPRIHWDNFAITIPVKNPNEIKWFALRVSEA
jgi:hypothetical protein